MHLAAHHPGRTPAPGVRALDTAAIAIEPGEAVGLVGLDATGTCTASRALTTLARPAAGTASVAGHHLLGQPPAAGRAIWGRDRPAVCGDGAGAGWLMLGIQGRGSRTLGG